MVVELRNLSIREWEQKRGPDKRKKGYLKKIFATPGAFLGGGSQLSPKLGVCVFKVILLDFFQFFSGFFAFYRVPHEKLV